MRRATHRYHDSRATRTGHDRRLPELDGTVDLVIVNPPYIPLEAFESVVPEARDHDPLIALFAGADGLDAIKVVAGEAARGCCVRPASSASSTLICKGESAQQILVQHGAFAGVRDHLGLAGRPRFVTAVRGARYP